MKLMILRLPIIRSTFDKQQLKLVVLLIYIAMQFNLLLARQGNSKMTQTTYLEGHTENTKNIKAADCINLILCTPSY